MLTLDAECALPISFCMHGSLKHKKTLKSLASSLTWASMGALLFKIIYFLIGGELLYKTVLVSVRY